MSMLGVTLLSEIIIRRQIFKADQILNELRDQLILSFQTENNADQKDGMDISICVFDSETQMVQIAGGNHSVCLYRNQESSGEKLELIKTDRMPVGAHPKQDVPFSVLNLKLEKSDRLFLFSDGFSSQFGGPKNEKLKAKGFQQILRDAQVHPLSQQKDILEKAFLNWQGNQAQIDDVLVFGIEV